MGKISEQATAMFREKQDAIKAISETKDLGITFANCLNNSVAVWGILAEHPEINVKEALEDISSLVDFFRNIKEGIRAETTTEKSHFQEAEQAVKEAIKFFPGSTVESLAEPPMGLTKLPPERPSKAQMGKIWHELNEKHYDKANHVSVASKLLGIKLTSFDDQIFTKAVASDLIKILVKDDVPF